jgi:putative ABC transport system permease protein
MNDLRFALRQLRRSPGFTAVAVLTLAVGIGACAAIFSVVNSVLLRPPPIPEHERVVAIEESLPGGAQELLVSFGTYHDWQRQASSFQSLGAFLRTSATLTGAGDPVPLKAARVDTGALATLRVQPLLGRGFLPEEEVEADRENVAMLGYWFWQRRFGGRPEILHETIRVNGRPLTVVGVMPRDSPLPEELEVFTPLGFSERQRANYQARWLQVVGRLKPGTTLLQAQSEMNAVATRVARARGDRLPWRVTLVPTAEAQVSEVRPVLLTLLGAVGLLLLIACANVANLLLARAASRSKEMAMRAALGARRARIVRQLVVESLVLSLLASALGVLFAQVGLDGLLALAPATLPHAAGIAVNGWVLTFTLGLALLTGVGFGLVPAFWATRPQLAETLQGSSRGASDGGARQRLRAILVVSELAIALVLLAGAGLLMRSFARLQEVNPGFNPEGAMIATVFLPRPKYRQPAQQAHFAEQALARIAALPGVTAVAVATNIPFSGIGTRSFTVAGLPDTATSTATGTATMTPGAGTLLSNHYTISPDYFRAMGIRLLQGRAFSARDHGGAPPVAIVNQAVVRRFFPAGDAIGRRIGLGGSTWREIVGVVADVRPQRLDGEIPLQSYEPFAQNPIWDFTLVVRGAGDEIHPALPGAIAAVISGLDPDLPTQGSRPLASLVADSFARQRFAMTLFVVFSAVALLLAAIGIYGVMAYAVSQRTKEIGIRMALGAQAPVVLRLVMAGGARLIALGLGAGLLGALILTRFLTALLFQVSAQDPLTFVAMALLLVAVALLACWLPARRAAALDPLVALREE